MAENSAESLPVKRAHPDIEHTTSASPSKPSNSNISSQNLEKDPKDQNKLDKKALIEAKKREKESKKLEKLQKKEAEKQEKLQKKAEKKPKTKEKEDESVSEASKSKEIESENSEPPSPKIKPQSMIEEDDEDYTPEVLESSGSELSLLSEERDHGDIEGFDIEEYKKFLASNKDSDED